MNFSNDVHTLVRLTEEGKRCLSPLKGCCCGLMVILLSCAAYADWHQVTDQPQWSQRSGHTSVVHGGKMWLLGGVSDDYRIPLTDTWSSEDGDKWSRALANAPWAPRCYHSSVDFGGKMWILGGCCKENIWASEDGINWSRMVEQAPWPYRYGQSALVFDDSIWVIGGRGGFGAGSYNDVWRSYDGVNWSQVQPSAPWTPRCFHASAVHDGKMWVVGGGQTEEVNNDPLRLNDVWSSSDGITWTKATAAAPWPPSSGCALVEYGNKLVLTGTSNGQIWSSLDGVTWELATDVPGWSWRFEHTSLVFDKRIWIIGGYWNYNVWSSLDGRTWSTTQRTVPWGEQIGASAVARSDTCWLTTGYYPFAGPHGIWRTSEGVNWSSASLNQPWPDRYWAGFVLYDGRLWVVGGYIEVGDYSEAYNDVWSSTDGSNWTRVLSAAPWGERDTHGAVLVYGGKLWLVGGGYGYRDVWNTTDGVNWTQITATAPWQTTEPQALVHDNRIWVRALPSNNLWWTTDGANWHQTVNKAPVGTQAELNGKIWVFEPLYDGRMWFSTDGETWALSDAKVAFGDRTGHTTFVYNDRLWVTGGHGGSWFSDLWYFQEQEVPFAFTVLPQGGWREEGASWEGHVAAVGLFAAATYQWRKDGVDIPGATTDTLSIPALALTDSASYTCILTDVATGAHETPPARINVFPANSLPGPGPIALLIGCLVLFVIFAFSAVEPAHHPANAVIPSKEELALHDRSGAAIRGSKSNSWIESNRHRNRIISNSFPSCAWERRV